MWLLNRIRTWLAIRAYESYRKKMKLQATKRLSDRVIAALYRGRHFDPLSGFYFRRQYWYVRDENIASCCLNTYRDERKKKWQK